MFGNMTREELEKALLAQYKKVVKAERERWKRPCDHITLRPNHLPCPHPSCLALPQNTNRLVVHRTNFDFEFAFSSGAPVPEVETEEWERALIELAPEEEFWGWRRVWFANDHPPKH